MHIDVIDQLDDFRALRPAWDEVYKADPEAQIFLSWQWLSDWLEKFRSVWFILAAKHSETDAEYVAFLPLRMLNNFDKQHGFSNELILAGAAYSDYTGILSRPEFEAKAVPAFAEYVTGKFNWARFTMDNLMISDRRRRLFLGAFDRLRFTHTPIEYKFPNDPSDHSICPAIALPADWNEYLGTLSANNRQKVRRLLRKIDAAEACRITVSDAGNFDENLTTLLDFWKVKWSASKGDKAQELAERNYWMLARCARNGTLFLPVFWHGDRPVAALATLIDAPKKSLLFFITGRDESYVEMPAGYLLHAYSIRYAIAQGFTTYDFLRGNEPYKYLFAPRERRLKAVSVVTKTGRNLAGKLDARGIPAMLESTLEFESKGESADAERGYRQILETEPDNALALYRFGRFMAGRGSHAEARELLSRSVGVEPEGDNAWLFLARSLYALGEDEAALEACRKVLEIQPQSEDAKTLIRELRSLTQQSDDSKPRKAGPAAFGQANSPNLRPAVEHVAVESNWVVGQLAAAAVHPDWVGKQLAAQGITRETRRKP